MAEWWNACIGTPRNGGPFSSVLAWPRPMTHAYFVQTTLAPLLGLQHIATVPSLESVFFLRNFFKSLQQNQKWSRCYPGLEEGKKHLQRSRKKLGWNKWLHSLRQCSFKAGPCKHATRKNRSWLQLLSDFPTFTTTLSIQFRWYYHWSHIFRLLKLVLANKAD